MNRLLWQLQLSNSTPAGKFVLESDSNWNLFVGKMIEMQKLDPELHVDVLLPMPNVIETQPIDLSSSHLDMSRVGFVFIPIIALAPVTRFDFPYEKIVTELKLHRPEEYTHVYINDPMLFRHYKAMFNLTFKTNPKFIVQTHFLDSPTNRKVPEEITYWQGTCEAVQRADVALWHSETTQDLFIDEIENVYKDHIVNEMKQRSTVWNAGYSSSEINEPIDHSALRFTVDIPDKTVIFVPNRIGGKGRSSDYTNCGKFMFEIVNKLYEKRQDFVVLAGNPSQKFSNDELVDLCKPYVKLWDNSLTRNEYRYVLRKSHINVGLYTNDTSGGAAWREAIDLGCLPLSPDIYEYSRYFTRLDYPFLVRPDLDDAVDVLSKLINYSKKQAFIDHDQTIRHISDFKFTAAVKHFCSYEATTKSAMKVMGLL